MENIEHWPSCGVERFLFLMEGPWATRIINELFCGSLRFTELKQKLPNISAHTLTHRLRRFESFGIVVRTVHAEVPPRVIYELTASGRALHEILYAMKGWGEQLEPKIIDLVDGSQEKDPLF